MTMFVIQSGILILIAFILGCIMGSLMHRFFAVETQRSAEINAEKERVVPEPTTDRKTPKQAEVSPVENKPEAKQKPNTKPEKAKKRREEPVKNIATVEPVPDEMLTIPSVTEMMAKDDLTQIRGIGPKIETLLNGLGVTSFPQIAEWTEEDRREIDKRLSFSGRIEKEAWVEQAQMLISEATPKAELQEVSNDSVPAEGVVSASISARHPTQAVPDGRSDDLTLIEGIGSALEKKLNVLGIYTFEQISQWDKDQQAWVGDEIGFSGRPERENWVSEAKTLLSGGEPKKQPKPKRGAIIAKRKS